MQEELPVTAVIFGCARSIRGIPVVAIEFLVGSRGKTIFLKAKGFF
jgi:hypothetical protein